MVCLKKITTAPSFFMKSKLKIFHGRGFPQPDIDVKMFVSIRLRFGYGAVFNASSIV